jgi:hypothetical protein
MTDSKETADDAGPHNHDAEIAALLQFEPVPRKFKRPDGWSPALQREFIAALAETGSPTAACEALGKNRCGVEKLYKSAGAESFRAAWNRAVEIAQERAAAKRVAEHRESVGLRPPFVDRRRKAQPFEGPLPGQVLNERGEWEDEESYLRRGEEAKDSICEKLLRCRRLFLMEISGSAGKRAAFEILTQFPVDWDKAARLEPQPDEPWRKPNMRMPDMILTAENGWMGDVVHGEDKKAELRKALDEYRASEGLPPVDWSESAEDSEQSRERHASYPRDASPDRTAGRRASSEPSPSDGGGEFTSPKLTSSSAPQDQPGPRVRRM